MKKTYKSRFSLIVEQILTSVSKINMVREVKNVSKFQTICSTTFYVIKCSHLDRLIHFISTY